MRDRFLWIQLGLITALSLVANYQIPDLNQSNWDTVLFLTPYGIINNYLHKESTVLWSFYSEVSSGQVEFSLSIMGLLLVIYFLMHLNVWKWLKK